MPGTRCPWLRLPTVRLSDPTLGRPLEIDHHACELCTRLLAGLPASPDAQALVSALAVRRPNGQPIALYGPDLEFASRETCTLDRYEQYCKSAHDDLRRKLAIDGSAVGETA